MNGNSGTGMTGRPGHRTMEVSGRSTVSLPHAHPSRTLLYAYFNRFGSKELFSFPGATWDHFRLYGGTFARSYSVSFNFCTNTCGTCNSLDRKYFLRIFLKYVFAPSQIGILTFAPSICLDTVAVYSHTPDTNT